MIIIFPNDVIKAIGDGLICPVCNLGYVKVEKVLIEKGSSKNRVLCSNCQKELMIIYQDKPFKIVGLKEMKN